MKKDKIYVLKLPGITKEEEQQLLAQPKFVNLFKVLKEITKASIWPADNYWLITSVNNSWATKKPRGGSHVNGQAVDVVPVHNLNGIYNIRLPIPLNRNILLAELIVTVVNRLKLDLKTDLPIIALEADHLHCDVLNPGGVILYNQFRQLLDPLEIPEDLLESTLNDKHRTVIA